MSEKTILATMTGEHFQPVRLHYRVLDRKRLLRAFEKLRCVDHDPARQRWVWLYDYEARGLPFKKSYGQIPRRHHPIVIGSFFLRGENKLLLDLRSCERAALAIPFFDRHIPRTAARVSEAEVVNRLFTAEESQLTPDRIFDRQETTAKDPEDLRRALVELTSHVRDPGEKLRIGLEHMQKEARQPLPEVERFPVHFYEDGIQGFTSALTMRQMVAVQHWLGNTDYSLHDVLQQVVAKGV